MTFSQIRFTRTTPLRHVLRWLRIHTRLIPSINLMSRETALTRFNIQSRILQKEIVGPQKQSHTLCGHQWEIFRPGEMRETERVPENDIGVIDVCVTVVFDPLGETH